MILTTTQSIEDYKILAYPGIVSGTAVNIQKTTFTFNMEKFYEGMSDCVSEVKTKAFNQLQEEAEKLNANAVVGISVDIEVTSSSYVMVSITGTAVSIVKR
jgi:uncharacterized protein YbjQ (UPF0145 family)